MLPSARDSVLRPSTFEDLTPRRIRHITGIQIRNLTPFPVRDAFTSALGQPVDTGGIIDELGDPLAAVRSRRISTASTATRRSLKREDNVVEQDIIVPSEVRGRRSSTSRVTFTNASSSPSNINQRFSSSKSNLSLRSNRTRTNSMTSSGTNQRLGSSMHLSPSSSLLPSNSQASLERVIGSRLVETFIVISTLSKNPPSEDTPSLSSATKSSRSAPASKATFTPPLTRPADKSQKHPRGASGAGIRSNSRLPPHSAHPTGTNFKPVSRTESGKTAPLRQITKSSSLTKGKAMASASVEEGSVRRPSPIYFSPIHIPSTNPYFAIDARGGHDFPSDCDDVGQFMKIEAWGKMSIMSRDGKFYEKASHEKANNEDPDWRLLDDWDLDLDSLVTFPDDFDTNSTQLPSNTLVLTLQPPGRRFCLPSSISAAAPRPESPAVGYSSDPESELRKIKHVTQQQTNPATASIQGNAPLSWKRRHKAAGNGFDPMEPAKTVAWQELFKLVTLQSLIADTRASLNNVVRSINELLEKDDAFPLRRDLSERESRIREWRKNHCLVLDQIAQRKQDLSERAQRLRERQELLASASKAITFNSATNPEIENQRNRVTQLRQRSTSMQTSLISSLSMIYPIEMYSSPDLLFTILDVPLPIPITASDPAPPLTLLNYKDVTEESVAAALGYVAQVLQFLAAYMGKSLVYPVTCIGSRSLIRDGISGMVGTRMFPLFSKGVDTFRFEYGVFLLNKDVETLMAERDLRALDMRHTLPNLKNLLLTLSHDPPARLPPPRNTPSPPPSTNESETLAESSSSSEESRTPKASHITPSSMSAVNTTPLESGANTPTISNDQRKGKSSFLGFVPFPDLLRVRYPSHSSEKTIRNGNATLSGEVSEDTETNEEDRRTIGSIGSNMACKELRVASPTIAPEGTIEA